MARSASNKLLHQAKASKSDEFYTLYDDIERELRFYTQHFRGKIVYCNCDEPFSSNFFLYFYDNFRQLGLKKLIASSYIPSNNDLFSIGEYKRGHYCVIDENNIDLPIEKSERIFDLNGDGDFRSIECINLLKQSDIVVTNPPFSLFREFVAQMIRYNKLFLIIGNINAITYKDIFGLIQQNQVWLGIHLGRGIFRIYSA